MRLSERSLRHFIREVIIINFKSKINEGPYRWGEIDPTSPSWFKVGDAVWVEEEEKFGRVLKQPDGVGWPENHVFYRKEGSPAGYYDQKVYFPTSDDANYLRGNQRAWTTENPEDPTSGGKVLFPFFKIKLFDEEEKVITCTQKDRVLHVIDALELNIISEEEIYKAMGKGYITKDDFVY